MSNWKGSRAQKSNGKKGVCEHSIDEQLEERVERMTGIKVSIRTDDKSVELDADSYADFVVARSVIRGAVHKPVV